jgi:hypothetical protein
MTKLFSNIAAIALVAIPAAAHAEQSEPVSFTHDGVSYTYTVEQTGERKVLRGHAGTNREPFVLNVGKSWVNGTANGSDVSFSLKSVKRIKGIVTVEQLAAR